MSLPNPLLIVLAFATLYLVWGSTYLAIRVAVQTMPPLGMASARFILAGAILWGILNALGRFTATPKQWRDNTIIGAFMLLGGNGLVVWAEQEVPSGIATLVISLNPIFMVLAEWIVATWITTSSGATATKPTTVIWLGLTLGAIGLLVLVWPALQSDSPERLDFWRIAALVGACISWTIGSIASRVVKNPAEPFSGAAIQMLGGGVWLGLAALCVGEYKHFNLAEISAASWVAWSYLLVAGSLLAFTAFMWLMKHCSPTLVSTYAYVNPIVAVYLGWLILNETIGPRIFVAATIIIFSVALITYGKQKR